MKGEYAKNKLPLNHEIEGDLSILAQHPLQNPLHQMEASCRCWQQWTMLPSSAFEEWTQT